MTMTLIKPERSARKPKGDGHTRRAEIRRAAERIFGAKGYEGATIRKIADEVGVSSTALYMHFRDKDQILLEICDQAMNELMAINRQIAARPADAVTRVRAMLEAYLAFAFANPNAYRLVFCAPSMADSIHRGHATLELGRQCFERFSGVVREIGAEGRLRTGDAASAAQVLWAACHGLIALRIAKPDFDWAPRETLTVVMIDGLLFGLIAD
ncbi:MAG: TetR/AcrR family transcriptional regulator [Caulobacteraceae bacterium]